MMEIILGIKDELMDKFLIIKKSFPELEWNFFSESKARLDPFFHLCGLYNHFDSFRRCSDYLYILKGTSGVGPMLWVNIRYTENKFK